MPQEKRPRHLLFWIPAYLTVPGMTATTETLLHPLTTVRPFKPKISAPADTPSVTSPAGNAATAGRTDKIL